MVSYTGPVVLAPWFLAASLSALTPGKTYAPTDPTVDDLCGVYRQLWSASASESKAKRREFLRRIIATCDRYTSKRLKDPSEPAPNWRPAAPGEDEASARIFRSGQPSSGTVLAAARARYKVDTIVNLRFDPSYRGFRETFGGGVPRLPISENEAAYRYAAERAAVEAAGMASVYAPTLPELEHFVGRYVPRLERGPGSKPWVCRLAGVPDGAKRHWLNDPPQTPREVAALERAGERPLLVSGFEDCRDWAEVYGREAVAGWMAETERAADLGNQLFIAAAERIRAMAARGKTVAYHCAGGTDRAGRVSLIIEAKEYGVMRHNVLAYRGPFSDPRIDLIAINYLLSERSGTRPRYRYLFPDLKRPDRSWLYIGLEPARPGLGVPAMRGWE